MASHYEALAAAFLRGRALQDDATVAAAAQATAGQAPRLPLHYFKRVPLLPRIQWALGVVRSVQPADLLDIGSGRGKFLWPLLDAFPALPVTAVDKDPRRVRDLTAVQLGGIERLRVRQADATRLPFADDAFDVVTMLEVLEHIRMTSGAIRCCPMASGYAASCSMTALCRRFWLPAAC